MLKAMTQITPDVVKMQSLMASHAIFHRVIKACEYAVKMDLEDEAKTTLKAGIVVTYMTPFGHGAGFERLGDEYTKFSGRDDLRDYHVDLETSRNSVYAHYGPMKAKKLLKHPELIKEWSKVKVTFRLNGGQLETRYKINRVTLLDVNFPKLIELCQYQANRVEGDLNHLIKEIYEKGNYPNGEYTLGEDFP